MDKCFMYYECSSFSSLCPSISSWDCLLSLVNMTTDRQCRASCSGDITTGAKPIPEKPLYHFSLPSLFFLSRAYWSGIQITDAIKRVGGKAVVNKEVKWRSNRINEKKRRGVTYISATTTPSIFILFAEIESIFALMSLPLACCYKPREGNTINPLWAYLRQTFSSKCRPKNMIYQVKQKQESIIHWSRVKIQEESK